MDLYTIGAFDHCPANDPIARGVLIIILVGRITLWWVVTCQTMPMPGLKSSKARPCSLQSFTLHPESLFLSSQAVWTSAAWG